MLLPALHVALRLLLVRALDIVRREAVEGGGLFRRREARRRVGAELRVQGLVERRPQALEQRVRGALDLDDLVGRVLGVLLGQRRHAAEDGRSEVRRDCFSRDAKAGLSETAAREDL